MDDKKKVCYVTTIALSIRSFFIPQLQYLSEHGMDVSVICSPDDNLQQELGDKVRFIPIQIPRGVSVGGMLRATRELIRVFEEEAFDLIQYSTPNAALCASVAAKKARVAIRNYHLMGFRYLGFRGVARWIFRSIEKFACRQSTDIECVSKSNLEWGITHRIFEREKATVVWNGSSGGVVLDRFNFDKRNEWREEKRTTLGIKEQDFVFGFAGRITKDKGIDEILEAFSHITKDCRLLLIGDIEGQDDLAKKIRELQSKDKRIRLVPFVADIEKYYAAMDVLLLPSYREGFGMVVAEAAALGTPAIISNIPGPTDVVEAGETALVVEPGDASSLQQKMELCLDNPKMAWEMSGKCRDFVARNFDSKILCEKILERKQILLKRIGG